MKLSPSTNLTKTIKKVTSNVSQSQRETNGLRILSENIFQDNRQRIHVVGEVQNILSTVINNLRINVAYFDPTGKILGTDFGFAQPDNIKANQTGTYEIITSKDTLAPGQYSSTKISYER